MGSFIGHVVPGTFFFGFSMWWLYNVFYRYFYAKRFRPTSYRNISCFPCVCRNNSTIEPCLKIAAATFGIIGEFYTGFKHGKWVYWGNAQHITMFFFFGVNGIVDLCQYKKWDLPPKLDYVTAALAFAVEAFLFYFHLHGRTHLDVMVHTFLFYAIFACCVFCIVEMVYPTNVLPALGRVFFTLLQATWFFQIGFILYPPIGQDWDEEDHTQMMIVTLVFAWHIAAVLATMFGLGSLIWLRVQNLPGQSPLYQIVDTADNYNEKDIFDMEDSVNHHSKDNHKTNGYLITNNSSSAINQILDSDSEDA